MGSLVSVNKLMPIMFLAATLNLYLLLSFRPLMLIDKPFTVV